MVHECPGCGRAYYCVHKSCGWLLSLKCDDCKQRENQAFVAENLRKAQDESSDRS